MRHPTLISISKKRSSSIPRKVRNDELSSITSSWKSYSHLSIKFLLSIHGRNQRCLLIFCCSFRSSPSFYCSSAKYMTNRIWALRISIPISAIYTFRSLLIRRPRFRCELFLLLKGVEWGRPVVMVILYIAVVTSQLLGRSFHRRLFAENGRHIAVFR